MKTKHKGADFAQEGVQDRAELWRTAYWSEAHGRKGRVFDWTCRFVVLSTVWVVFLSVPFFVYV